VNVYDAPEQAPAKQEGGLSCCAQSMPREAGPVSAIIHMPVRSSGLNTGAQGRPAGDPHGVGAGVGTGAGVGVGTHAHVTFTVAQATAVFSDSHSALYADDAPGFRVHEPPPLFPTLLTTAAVSAGSTSAEKALYFIRYECRSRPRPRSRVTSPEPTILNFKF